MKICLGFYGLVHRSLSFTFKSIKKNIIDVLEENNIEYDNDLEFDKVYNAIKDSKFEILNSFEIKIFTLPIIFKFLIFHLLIALLLFYLFRQIWN